jgi:hypothetical protein
MLKRFILPCILLMAIGVLSLQGQSKAEPQPKLVLRVTATGGMCPNGACGSEIMLYDDGTGSFGEGPKKKSFAVGSEEASSLVALIGNTDFEALRKNKFTGLCPTAYDGQEFIYLFSTPHGEETLDSCKTAINEQSPLFKAIQKIKAKAYDSGSR